jgi:rRNA maturation RNase YbeY
LVHFFSEDIPFSPEKQPALKKWIKEVIHIEKLQEGEINYIYCSDDFLHKMNLDYLQHDTFTDILTFDQAEGNEISGDIYISVERVKENARTHNSTFTDELHRVMIHGILHLAGYGDKTPKERQIMREKEDVSLSLRKNLG